jgi:hypothetical protein
VVRPFSKALTVKLTHQENSSFQWLCFKGRLQEDLMVSKILLWLFAINLGLVFGAVLYEARIEFPQWLLSSEP